MKNFNFFDFCSDLIFWVFKLAILFLWKKRKTIAPYSIAPLLVLVATAFVSYYYYNPSIDFYFLILVTALLTAFTLTIVWTFARIAFSIQEHIDENKFMGSLLALFAITLFSFINYSFYLEAL